MKNQLQKTPISLAAAGTKKSKERGSGDYEDEEEVLKMNWPSN